MRRPQRRRAVQRAGVRTAAQHRPTTRAWLTRPELVEIMAATVARRPARAAARLQLLHARQASSGASRRPQRAGRRRRRRAGRLRRPPPPAVLSGRPSHGRPCATDPARVRLRRGDANGLRRQFRDLNPNEPVGSGRCCRSSPPGGGHRDRGGARWFFLADRRARRARSRAQPGADAASRTTSSKLAQAVNLDALRAQRAQVQQYVTQLEKQLPSKAEMDALLSDINQAGPRPQPAVRAVPPGPGGGEGLLRRAADRRARHGPLSRHRRLRLRRRPPVAHRHAEQPERRRPRKPDGTLTMEATARPSATSTRSRSRRSARRPPRPRSGEEMTAAHCLHRRCDGLLGAAAARAAAARRAGRAAHLDGRSSAREVKPEVEPIPSRRRSSRRSPTRRTASSTRSARRSSRRR